MGKVMSEKDFKEYMKQNGFRYSRKGKGDHEIWVNDAGDEFPVTLGGSIKKGLLWQFKRRFNLKEDKRSHNKKGKQKKNK